MLIFMNRFTEFSLPDFVPQTKYSDLISFCKHSKAMPKTSLQNSDEIRDRLFFLIDFHSFI